MTTTQTGKEAEDEVAKQLSKKGYKIIAQNWRTRWCEIDIVATKKDKAYFVEVKYRKSNNWGDGLEAITTKKLEQMTFAAELWVQNQNWNGDYNLAVASVSGDPPKIQELFEL